MDRTALISTVIARVSAASKPGRRDDAAFEAASCLDAIDEHVAAPRDYSADFIERQWNRVAVLMARSRPSSGAPSPARSCAADDGL